MTSDKRLSDLDRLERAHDEADKYQIRALNAEAEVSRLREELSEVQLNMSSLREHYDMWKQQWEEMRDTMWKPAMDKLARVEVLPRLWRRRSDEEYDRVARNVERELAAELDEALRGES
jgi:hypothetical protein